VQRYIPRRAPIGPGLWPGPRHQARWAGRGLQRQRRAAGAAQLCQVQCV